MTTTKKPQPYRQMSFTYDPPSARQKRKSFSKQFSEDITELKASLLEQNVQLRVSLNGKSKRNATDRPPPAKVAWTNDTKEEAVVVKKCKETRRAKLTRHASLEKESILNSKQDLSERLRTKKEIQEPEKENKPDPKPNLEIFLAGSNPKNGDSHEAHAEKIPPKYLQPLVADNNFQIKKSGSRKVSESPRRPKSSTVVVVPLIDKDQTDQSNSKNEKSDEASGINVIIRPVTAQSRRERFQKRTNSAFHGAVKEQQPASRPPLVRSSSAPSTRPEKSKFLATKRKMKSVKKFKDEAGSRNNVDTKEWQNAIQHPTDIVTMVSLVSPGGSDNEEEVEEEIEPVPTERERPKSVLKQESTSSEKTIDKDTNKNMSLRKTIKSVSFQQSSIHAIRSFSASFPSRRSSMATAMALNTSQDSNASSRHAPTKNHEKRGTNPSSPNSEERLSKRRSLRSNTDENNQSLSQKTLQTNIPVNTEETDIKTTFAINIQAKSSGDQANKTIIDDSLRLNLEENIHLKFPDEQAAENVTVRFKIDEEDTSDSPKEKQCWEMYCKMTKKGINVSYDTLLRGLLTPTEYRMRRKSSIVDEFNLLIDTPTLEATEVVSNPKIIE